MKKKFNKKKEKPAKMAPAREAAPAPSARDERPRDVLHDAARKAGIFLLGSRRR